MTTVQRLTCAVLALVLAAAAGAQEQSDADAEFRLIEDAAPVAEDEAGNAEPNTDADDAPQVLTEDDVLREHARFLRLLDEQNFDAADIAAKRVIEMSIKVHGPQSHETAKALINLAVVQNTNQQYEAAIQNFTSSIEIIEVLEDRLNSELVNPLRGLGAAQLGSGRPDLARDSFARATHITHVNEGPHNIEQVELLESLAEANVRLGELEAARDVLDRIHILNVRHFSDDALGLLPSLMRRAGWQHRAGYYNDERATYRRAIRIIEDSAGKDDPRLVDPLIRLGESYYYFEPLSGATTQYVTSSTGEAYLKRANRVAESSDDFPWLELATTKLALADYYVYSESYNRARKIYAEVWNDLSADEQRRDMRSELLGKPRPIWIETLPPYTNGAAGLTRGDSEIRSGAVTVVYDVTHRGRARIKEVSVTPPEFEDMRRMVEREIKRRIYRPVVADGAPTESNLQTFTHEFRYSRSELEELRAGNSAAAGATD